MFQVVSQSPYPIVPHVGWVLDHCPFAGARWWLSEGVFQLFLGPEYPCTSVPWGLPASITPHFTHLISMSNASSLKGLFKNVFCL